VILRTAAGSNPARPPARRAGFTLLEILLASLIAALLLSALYAALHTTLLQTQTTRDAVEIEDLSRGIINRMTLDLSGTLAPLPPKSGGNSAASGGTTAAAASGTTPSSSSAPAPAAGAGAAPAVTTAAPAATADPTTGAAPTPGATDNATAFLAAPMLQGGVYCQDPTTLVLFLGRTPEVFGRSADSINPNDQVRADQRQVIYKFVSGRGLYRAERPWVTADNLSLDLDPDAPESVLLADEVADFLVEFSDGTSWTGSWDGTVPGPDGVTPLGPPRAVRVTLTLQIATGRGDPIKKTVAQVIPVRAAPGTYTPPLLEAPTDGATDGSGSSGNSGSSGSSGSTGGAAGGASSGSTGGKAGSTGGAAGAATGASTGGKAGGSTGGSMPAAPSGGSSGGGKAGGSTGGSMPAAPAGGSSGGSTGGGRPSGSSGGSTGGSTGGSGGARTGGGK
jgi:prepilin-type N-terminal cleavage/methylation domain-containing protein